MFIFINVKAQFIIINDLRLSNGNHCSILVSLALGSLVVLRFLDWKEQLELDGQLVLGVEAIGEVDPPNSAVGVNLDLQSLNVVGAVSSPREVRQVELNLVPPVVQTHRHRADEGFHPGCGLVVGSSESSSDILVVKDLYFESEVLLQVLNNHHKKRKLDPESFARVRRARDESG